ncbi:MAG: hypothetical protein Q9M20_08475, partial [Mariprofundaceae bacterium]|nr:hypothetical protein [Mariprofundaceae bacterium]
MIEMWHQVLSLFSTYGLWIATASLIMFIGSIASIPLLVVRIPVDYFTPEGHQRQYQRHQRHLLLHLLLVWSKNLCGV